MRYARQLAVVIALSIGASGCNIFSKTQRGAPDISLPPLPVDIASACRDPGVRTGQPVIGEFARNRAAFAKCRRGGLVNENFYNDLRGK